MSGNLQLSDLGSLLGGNVTDFCYAQTGVCVCREFSSFRRKGDREEQFFWRSRGMMDSILTC